MRKYEYWFILTISANILLPSTTLSKTTFPLLLTPIPPSYMVVPESNIANTHYSKKLMNPNVDSTKARPDDTALSIQRGRPPSCMSTESSHSSSPSLMDDSLPSDCDYAEQVAVQNNMDIEADNAPPAAGPLRYKFAMLPLQTPCAPHEDVPNDPTLSNNFNTSLEPSPPMVILYSANVPADPNLWDSNFTATSLFGTNEFLQSDICNMACSLQCMACFLKQCSLEGHNGNNIPQLELFGESAWDFISVIFESGWDQLHSSENTSIQDNISTHFGNIQTCDRAAENNAYPKTSMVRKTLPPIPPCPSKEQMENLKKRQIARLTKGKNSSDSPMSYAQATNTAASILKIKEVFPALPNKKILEIHDTAFPKLDNKGYRIQHTTKGPSRKQTIVPTSDKIKDIIMEEANTHIFQINMLLKNIKSIMRAEFIRLCPGGVSINTNSVPSTSDLNTIERYLKLINGTSNDEVLALWLSQSKLYLKITGIPYIQPNGNKLTGNNITTAIKHLELFKCANLAAKPRVIKASPKSDMAIIWFGIWDSQNGSKAKLLINHSFNFGRHITTIRATNMNPGVPQCHNCWKWGHSTFSCRIHGSRCQKYHSLHKLEHHRDLAWCCKANFKLNSPRLETAKGEPCPHNFKCINCKGKHMADDNKCPFWKHRFNCKWHSKKAQEARETRANSTHLAVGSNKI